MSKKTISIEVHESPTPDQCLDDLEVFLNTYIGKSWEWHNSDVDTESASIGSLNIWYLTSEDEEEYEEEELPF